MARYVVLKNEAEENGSRVCVMRDHFSVVALAFPLPWLLFNRLWLEALIAIFALACIGLLASQLPTVGISLICNLALGALIGLEGERWAIAKAKRRGFHEIGTIADAANREEAELRAYAMFGVEPDDATAKPMRDVSVADAETADMFFGRA
ncbi:MAG: DUF2628 domain-containing protein [Pseudomonadota bacterium]